jgi:ubiquitin C-terminal hydrolase
LVKFRVEDALGLWHLCIYFKHPQSVNINDTSAVKSCIKPTRIALTDIYAKHKKPYNLKRCFVKLNASLYPNTNVDINTPSLSPVSPLNSELDQAKDSNASQTITRNLEDSLYVPKGIYNPSNHCYINSILQVLFCILWHEHNSFDSINENREGHIVQCMKDVLQHKVEITTLKQLLASYDALLDGKFQQDCHECLILLMNILHLGTRYSLLGDEFMDDSVVTSLPKRIFSFVQLETFECSICHFRTSHASSTNMLAITQLSTNNISQLLQSSLYDKVDKNCHICNILTSHQKIVTLNDPPSILIILVSRFRSDGGLNRNKNNIKIRIERYIEIKGMEYELLGVVHHLGDYISSGHYKAFVRYQNFFECNDSHIFKSHYNDTESSTAVLLFYKRTIDSNTH